MSKLIWLALLVVLVLPSNALAQERQKIDSLVRLLQVQDNTPDTTKINWLFNLAFQYFDINNDSARLICAEGMAMSQRLSYPRGIVRGYLTEGLILRWVDNKTDAARIKYDSALQIAQMMNNPKLMGACYGNLGQIYQAKNNFSEALHHFEKAVLYAEKAGDKLSTGKAMSNVGIVWYTVGDYNRALDYFTRAIQCAIEVNDRSDQAYNAQQQAKCLMELKKYDQAETCLRKSLAVAQTIQNKKLAALALFNLGKLEINRDETQGAIAFLTQARAIASTIVGPEMFDIHIDLAKCYFKTGRFDEAIQIYREAILFDSEADKKSFYLFLLGEAYHGKGENGKAKYYLQQSLSINRKIGNLYEWQRSCELLSDIYRKEGNLPKAFEMLQQSINLSDDIYNEAIVNKLSEQNLRFQFERRHQADSLDQIRQQLSMTQKLESQRANNLAAWSVAGLTLALAFGFWNRNRLRLARKEFAFRQKTAESEMTALRAQMNPHFIFNSLNSINAYILRNDGKTANAYLTGFAHLMRQILDNSARETISLENEIEFLQSYLRTEAMRLENKLTWDIQVADNVDTFETEIPSMILQPYVENAVWHGIAHKPEGGKITVSIGRDAAGALLLAVEDNGVGRARARELRITNGKPHESKGLKITEERLALYDQKHGTRSSVTTTDLIDSEGNATGTRVEVRIS